MDEKNFRQKLHEFYLFLVLNAYTKNEKSSLLNGKRESAMYKTIVIEYSPKADDMALKVEEKANEMLQTGYKLITMSITGSAKAILVFENKE